MMPISNEDPDMPDKLQEFVRQSIDELLQSLPPEELRKRLSPEERLQGFLRAHDANSIIDQARI